MIKWVKKRSCPKKEGKREKDEKKRIDPHNKSGIPLPPLPSRPRRRPRKKKKKKIPCT
jgi:hypothetical protein